MFTLGQITVLGAREATLSVGDAAVSREEIWAFNTNALDDAVKLVPGVSSNLDSNGRRNERDILVRGFGRLQVPLSIDGIRVYLPADNRLDFGRFLTQDLAEIQIQKGYASVLDGPGGLGGAINLVTRKPTRELESEFQSGVSAGTDGDYSGWNGSAALGTRQDTYYLQASGSYFDRDAWQLSRDFGATSIEDGGERDGSDARDWRINVKAGFTPNDTDEYSISYTSQSGSKGAPLHVFNDPPNPPNSYWRWPEWDIDNLYWLSMTRLGTDAYLKTRLFYNTFDNALYAYDDRTYTTQSANGRFRSIYADTSYGGSVELGSAFFGAHTLRASLHYRRDEHTERSYNRPTHPASASTEPLQKTLENTWSVAIEDTYELNSSLNAVMGVSYDDNEIDQAQDFTAAAGLFEYPTGGSSAVNAQTLFTWKYADAAALHASVSSRTRFPTVFERFSTRFGTAIPNPDLDSERGTNLEVGWRARIAERADVSAAIFYSDVDDMIQTVVVSAGPPPTTQTQNVGDGEYYGLELASDVQVNARWHIGGNYTYLKRKIIDPLQPNLRPTGTPTHQGLLFLTYQPSESWSITPSLELADERWSDVTGGTYLQVGDYVLTSLQVRYRVTRATELSIGGRNLLDESYQLAHGFPEPGRSWFAKLRVSY